MSNITTAITGDAIQSLLLNLVLDRLTKSDTIVSCVAISIVGVAWCIKEIVKHCREDPDKIREIQHKDKKLQHKDKKLETKIILAKIKKGIPLTDPK